MTDDDAPVGRLLTRREVLALIALGGAGTVLGCRPDATGGDPSAAATAARAELPGCVVRPEQTEGPYFVDEDLDRSDIRSDPATGVARDGLPLALAFHVSRFEGARCRPLPGARVDVWHCDAHGVYSDVRDPSFDTTGQKFLRGHQRTDAEGIARFATVFPGWYRGRAVHVHFKVRTEPGSARGHEFTSQLYFDDALTDRVHARPPYASHGVRDRRNAEDGIFADGGETLMVALAEAPQGYAGRFEIALRLE